MCKYLILLLTILIFGCYNYLSDEIPVVVNPYLNKKIPILSIQVRSSEGRKEEDRITELYKQYLQETGHFGRVISGGVRAPYHIDIYTAVVDEYENFFLTFASSFFSLATAGILPAFSGQKRVLRARIYKEGNFLGERVYFQKHTTLYSLIFIFIWERGIEESAKIGYNKEKNLIHNLVEDLNEF